MVASHWEDQFVQLTPSRHVEHRASRRFPRRPRVRQSGGGGEQGDQ